VHSWYDLPTLILIAVQSQRSIRRPIWCYLTWANVQLLLNGHDLGHWAINRDHSTGKLEQLLAATLDQIISDRAEAETFC